MNIKLIIAALVILLLGFIGYNNYSSYQNKKNVEARSVEIEALNNNNAQAMAALKRPDVVADIGVELEPIDDKPSKADNDKLKSETCKSISEFSESAMEARLRGIPIQDALGAIDGGSMSVEYKDAFKDIIIQAYKKPNYQTDDIKERAIREFALKQYLACISAFDKRK